MALGRILPSALCQGVGVLKLGVFRGSIAWPAVPPVYASYPALRLCPQDSEPVWLARPSPYDSFIRYTLPDSMPAALPAPPVWWCKHAAYGIGLTLRHDTPKRELRSNGLAGLMFTQVNVRGISRLDQFLKMFVVASENWFLRQSAVGVSDVNALQRKNFL